MALHLFIAFILFIFVKIPLVADWYE